MFRLSTILAILPWLLGAAEDPFAGLKPSAPSAPAAREGFFRENFAFKREVFSQFSYDTGHPPLSSRQSVGFEALKKFSSPTATTASLDVQVRAVRRDRPGEVTDDMEGMSREGWFLEYHNLYVDFYNVAGSPGRLNLRVGRFYLPFGLNHSTDTHGTVLQLSNERNFGFERDWHAGLWGTLGPWLTYDAYALLGSGYDVSLRGQSGLLGTRLGLSEKARNEHGIEAGLSFLGGQRVSREAVERSPSVAGRAGPDAVVDTHRVGADARWTRLVPTGSASLSTELSLGHDGPDDVATELWQADYLSARRRWGLSAQYRRFWEDIGPGAVPVGEFRSGRADASALGEFAWYFRNDVGGAFLESVRLDAERQLERQAGGTGVILTLQYYRYW